MRLADSRTRKSPDLAKGPRGSPLTIARAGLVRTPSPSTGMCEALYGWEWTPGSNGSVLIVRLAHAGSRAP